MPANPPLLIKTQAMECGEYGCPTDAGRVEFRSDGEVTFVFQCRHKYSSGPWQAHWRRVNLEALAKEAMRRDPAWLGKFLARMGLTTEIPVVL